MRNQDDVYDRRITTNRFVWGQIEAATAAPTIDSREREESIQKGFSKVVIHHNHGRSLRVQSHMWEDIIRLMEQYARYKHLQKQRPDPLKSW